MTVFFIENIFEYSQTSSISKIKLILLIPVLTFAIKRPAKEVLMCGDRDVNALQLFHAFRSPNETMSIFYRPDEKLHDDIEKLKRIIPKNSNIVSIKKSDPERDGYASTQLIAYECKSKYFGQTFEIDSTFNGYIVSWKEEVGEKVFDSDGGVKVYFR
jgi:hypothetical protein